MSRPVIGITYRYKKPWKETFIESSALNTAYSRGVETNGGVPMLIPYTSDTGAVTALLRLCDGLLIPGGDDGKSGDAEAFQTLHKPARNERLPELFPFCCPVDQLFCLFKGSGKL